MVNFRCWGEKKVKFTGKSVILISGKSGAGKSTVIKAIRWTLYGGKEVVVPISKKGDTSVSTIVELKIIENRPCPFFKASGPITISVKRTTNSITETFTCTDGKEKVEFTGEEANSAVILLYGNRELWSFTCFTSLSEKNTFVRATPAVKMAYLSRLAFPDEKLLPSQITEKLNKTITDLRGKINTQQKLAEQAKRRLKSHDNYDFDLYLNEDERKEFKRKEKEYKGEIERRNKLIIRKDEALKSRKNAEMRLGKIKEPSKPHVSPDRSWGSRSSICISSLSKGDLEELRRRIGKKIKLLREFDQKEWERVSHMDTRLSHSSILKLKEQKKKHELNKSLCRKLNLEYNQESIDEKKKELKNLISLSERIKTRNTLLRKIEDTKRKLKNLDPVESPEKPIPKSTEEIQVKLVSLRKEIEKEKGKLVELKCPSCNSYLKYKNSCIELCETQMTREEECLVMDTIQKNKDEIILLEKKKKEIERENDNASDEYDKMRRKYKTYLSEKDKMKSVEVTLNTLTSQLEDYNDVGDIIHGSMGFQSNDYKKEYETILPAQYVEDISISLDDAETFIRLRDIYTKLSLYDDIACKCETELESMKKDIDNWMKYISDMKEYNTERKVCEDLLKTTIVPDTDTEKEKERISFLKSEVKIINERLRISPLISIYYSDQKEYNNCLKASEKYERTLKTVNNILIKHRTKEKGRLGEIINPLVSNVNLLLSLMFDQPISISISLDKTLTDGREKRMINMKINYEGSDDFPYSELHDGAKARFDIIFSAAQAGISSFPYLIMDETISTLDWTNRELCLNVLLDYFKNTVRKTLIIISHGHIEGFCEQQIKL